MKHIQSFAWHGRNPDNYAFRFFAVWLFLMINDRARSVWEFFGAYAEYFGLLVFMCGACFCFPCHSYSAAVPQLESRVTNFVSKILSRNSYNTNVCFCLCASVCNKPNKVPQGVWQRNLSFVRI